MDDYRKKITNKWSDLKKQIKSRPLLAYIVGIPIDQYNEYIHTTPENEEVLRIEQIILQDRKIKTERIKQALQQLVGYRETVQAAYKIGISDTTIRNILSGVKKGAGYDVINRLEIYLNAVSDFELSIENNLSPADFLINETNAVSDTLRNISIRLSDMHWDITKMARTKKLPERGAFFETKPYRPTDTLRSEIERLQKITERLDILIDTYINPNNQTKKM